MKNNIKEIIAPLLVAVVVFVVSFAIFNYLDVKEKGEAVAEMSNPSYPVMELVSDDITYNLMWGYRGDVDLSFVRNNIALTDSNGKIGLRLHTFDYDINTVTFATKEMDYLMVAQWQINGEFLEIAVCWDKHQQRYRYNVIVSNKIKI